MRPSTSMSTIKNAHDMFWIKPDQDDWMSTGNGRYAFLLDRTATFIGEERVACIVDLAKCTFSELLRVMPDCLPKSWGDAGILATALFVNQMEELVPELALCADHWKARQVGTFAYPDWTKRRGKEVKMQHAHRTEEIKRKRETSTPLDDRPWSSDPTPMDLSDSEHGPSKPAVKRARTAQRTLYPAFVHVH